MHKHDFAIYCKSFRDDFERLRLMLATLVEFGNKYPVLLSVPSADLSMIREVFQLPEFVVVIEDEAYTIPGSPFPQGWFQQQVCKLSVHRTGFAESYAMIDSDTYFVNNSDTLRTHCGKRNVIASHIFTKYFAGNDDLVRYIGTPETALQPVTGLQWNKNAPELIIEYKSKLVEIERLSPDTKGGFINNIFGVQKLAFQPSQFFHSYILSSFESFLSQLGVDFYDCIKISPWEYNWYASYAMTRHSDSVIGVCSPILHFASDADVQHAKSVGINIENIRRRFSAVQMAARHFPRMTFDE